MQVCNRLPDAVTPAEDPTPALDPLAPHGTAREEKRLAHLGQVDALVEDPLAGDHLVVASAKVLEDLGGPASVGGLNGGELPNEEPKVEQLPVDSDQLFR